ncbi:MAG: YihY/virulence factor BrkB family protein [Lentisphaerae bacterium]|nr:YihY/virulence factor BrkB family protein [Lentisphaerota bacterium]
MNINLRRTWRFLSDEVWDVELSSLSRLRALGVRFVRVVNLVFRGFREDECPLHASALTFSTLMSIVPILALSLAVARGLGGEEIAKDRIREGISTWTETFREHGAHAAGDVGTEAARAVETAADGNAASAGPAADPDLPARIEGLVEQAFEKVGNINFAALSGVGLAILIVTVVNVLGRVEGAFNRVWGVTAGRSLWRRFADYLSILFVLPILAIAASSLPAADFATRFLDERTASMMQAFLGSGFLKQATVLVMSTLCFGFLLIFMPNTRVRADAGLTGGLVTALLFLGWLWVCATLQVGAARAGRIYGSFAILPILLAWVHVSWQIVLFGAETAFAVQNCTTYKMEQGAGGASMRARLVLGLSVVRETARVMNTPGTRGLDAAAYAREHRVPVRLLNEVVGVLVRAGVLGALSDREARYVLLRPPSGLTVQDVTEAMLGQGVGPRELGLDGLEREIMPAAGAPREGARTIQDLA